MYLFTRSARLRPGHLQESMEWSLKATEKVNQISEIAVSLWSPVFSAGVGGLTWVAMVEELAALEATDDKLMADPGYVALVDEGAKFVADSGIDDSLWQYLHVDPDGATAQPKYVNLVEAVLAPGHFLKGVELGIEIAQQAKRITGRPTSFAIAESGPYGAVQWSSLADSVEQLQAGKQGLTADAEFARLIDEQAGSAYQPAATQVMYRKIA
jgi:hypothetical protein